MSRNTEPAKERLYTKADRKTVVEDGHPEARFLYAAKGQEVAKDLKVERKNRPVAQNKQRKASEDK